jgi:DNA-binding NarL/FixJ family response regulator
MKITKERMANGTGLITKRQGELVQLLCGTCLEYKEMAYEMKISLKTVETMINKVYKKYGVHSRIELILLLLRGE